MKNTNKVELEGKTQNKGGLFLIAFFMLMFLTGCSKTEYIPCSDYYEEYIIIDILKYDVNDWGSDGCVFESSKGKISVKGDFECMSQIGDSLFKEVKHNNSCDTYISNYFHKRIYSTSNYTIIQDKGD